MRKIFVSLSLGATLAINVWADYPRLNDLRPSDVLYSQLQADIQAFYRASSRHPGRPYPPLVFFTYQRRPDDTIFTLAARLNLPYETIASLNGISQAAEFSGRSEIIVPNSPGLFIPLAPANALEEIMIAGRGGDAGQGENTTLAVGGEEKSMIFFRGERYRAVERAYFLKILLLFPLRHSVITSRFGARADPFNGHTSFHRGIDLGAPLGTPVLAAREGTVLETGYNEIYGNFVRLTHPGGYQTLYGHLSAVFVKKSERASAGLPLGKVGVTGRSTGPHLHFEVLKDGKPINPHELLPLNRRSGN